MKFSFGNSARPKYQLPVPRFVNPRFENGEGLIDIQWENMPVSDECFANAKDMCTSISCTQITTINLDQLSVWNDALKEKNETSPCKYLSKVSYSVFAAQLAIAGLKEQKAPCPETPKAA